VGQEGDSHHDDSVMLEGSSDLDPRRPGRRACAHGVRPLGCGKGCRGPCGIVWSADPPHLPASAAVVYRVDLSRFWCSP